MAGTPQAHPADTKHYVDYEEYVDFQLEKTRASIKRTDILTTLTTLAVVLVAYLLAFVIFDQWIIEGGFGFGARVGLLAVLSTAVVAVIAGRVLWPLLRRVHPLYAARVIERSDSNLKSNLVNFVDVRQANAQSAPVVLKAMEKRAAVELSHIDVDEAVDHRPLLRVAYALLAVVVVSALYIIFSPKDPLASVRRALFPTAVIEVATETSISDVAPGDKDVPARTVLTIEADVRGKDADHAQILFTTADHKYVDQPVEMKRIEDTLPRFRGVLNGENGRGLLQGLTYRITSGDARTRDFAIKVIQPPGARADDVRYVFPQYMQFDEKTTPGGHIDGWEGADVTVNATTNMPVKEAYVVLTDAEDSHARGEEIRMQVSDGTKLSGNWKLNLREDGSSARYYHIEVRTADGETDPDPTQFTYRVRPDQRPEAELLAPTGDLAVPSNGIIPLVIQATDPDFQLRSITLKSERNGEALRDQRLFNDPLLMQSFRGSHDFALEPLGLKAGDTLFFWIEARDNKQPTANRGTTPRIKVTVGKPASAKEVQQELAKEKQDQQDQLARADEAVKRSAAADDEPPPEAANDDDLDKRGSDKERQGPRADQPAADEARPKNERRGPDDDAASPPKDEDQGQAQKPARDEFQQTLKKLLQKEREQTPQDNDQGQESERQEKPQPADKDSADQPSAGKTAKNRQKPSPDNSKDSSKPGDESSPGAKPSPEEKPQGEKSRDEKSADEKSSAGDRSGGKNQAPPDKGQSTKKDATDKKPGAPDAAKQPPNGEEGQRNKTGGTGKSKDQTDKPENDRPDTSGDEKGPTGEKKTPGEKADAPRSGHPDKDGSSKDGPPDNEKSQKNDAKNGGKKDAPKNTDPAEGPNDDAGEKGNARDRQEDGSKSDKPGDEPQSDDQAAGKKSDKKKPADAGTGKQSGDKHDSASDPKEAAKGTGAPGQSDKPESDQQPAEGEGQKSKKIGEGKAKPGRSADPAGEEKPADDSPDAVKKPATGKETGEAAADEEGDPQAPRAQNDLKRKEGDKTGAKKTGDEGDPSAKKSAQRRKPEDGTKSAADDAEQAQRPPDGKKESEQPAGEIDDPPSQRRRDPAKPGASEKRPGQPPEAGNQDLHGPGRKEGQKAESSDTGEEGSSSATDQGKKGANKAGAGDKSDEPGNTDPASKETGQPGSKPGKGSTTKPADGQGKKESGAGDEAGDKAAAKSGKGQPGDKAGQGADGQGAEGQADDQKPGEKAGGKPGSPKAPSAAGPEGKKAGDEKGKGGAGKPGSKSADGKADGQSSQPGSPGKAGDSKSGAGITSRPGEGKDDGDGPGGPSDAEPPKPRDRSNDELPPAEDEEARLDFARHATNLVLKKLKGQLERGEVDQELLDELGWKNKGDVERFIQRLEQGLKDANDDDSPEAIARRREFEETLKSLPLGNETSRRPGGAGSTRVIRQMGPRRIPVPPEYQKLVESYTRSLSKQSDKAAGGTVKKPSGK